MKTLNRMVFYKILLSVFISISFLSCTDFPKIDKRQERILNHNWNKFYEVPKDSLMYIFNAVGIKLEKGDSFLSEGKLTEVYTIKFRIAYTDSIRTVEYNISNRKVDTITSTVDVDNKYLFILSNYDYMINQKSIVPKINAFLEVGILLLCGVWSLGLIVGLWDEWKQRRIRRQKIKHKKDE